eukprot:TRINITY_DN11_c0_g1_i1.p1 TRINITY_DN11_c0_g1~~TRINITY_DN11_c0_g1_i1.p1  ORF type:complete len:613 (-),score=87.51 TRINITY_DN11_c0_g1_i1:33-1871(-)
MNKLTFFALSLLFLSVCFSAQIYDGLKNSDVKRFIDLNSSLAKHKITLTVTNTGNENTEVVYLTIQQEQDKHLALFSARDEDGILLTVTKDTSVTKEGVVFYKVNLGKALPQGSSKTLKIKAVFSHSILPYPSHITQSERQLVKYKDNVLFFSPYVTEQQTTTLKLASASIQSNTQHKPTTVRGDTITYGPYLKTSAYSSKDFTVHYENNKPFLSFTQLERFVEVSHWGNVAVEDWANIRHDGAQLKGSFSRYEFQINPQANGQSAIKSFVQYLPSDAEDVYYRDDIGNVTTSHLSFRQRSGKPVWHLELIPRFPLFGGWKTDYYMGYNLPLYRYLFTRADDSSSYLLNVTFGPEFQNSISIDKHIFHVILPEGASDIDVKIPFSIDSQSEYKHYTYLDTVGRPVVKVEKHNTVNEHCVQYIQVTYTFGRLAMLREPFLLITSYLAFFGLVMIYLRFELSISKAKSNANITASKLNDQLTKYHEMFKTRIGHHNDLETALEKFLKHKNAATYQDERKAIEGRISRKIQDIQRLVTEIQKLDEGIGAKVTTVEKKLKDRESVQSELHKLIKQNKEAKGSSKTFEDQKVKLTKDLERLDSEIEVLIADLTEDLE